MDDQESIAETLAREELSLEDVKAVMRAFDMGTRGMKGLNTQIRFSRTPQTISRHIGYAHWCAPTSAKARLRAI